MSNKMYAWYQYPEPDGTLYSKDDLMVPAVVEELFDYSQILLATIHADGWAFLFSHYTIEELIEIDKKSGWFQPCTTDEFKDSLERQSLIAGYNPSTKEFGDY